MRWLRPGGSTAALDGRSDFYYVTLQKKEATPRQNVLGTASTHCKRSGSLAPLGRFITTIAGVRHDIDIVSWDSSRATFAIGKHEWRREDSS
jgi:hypothetical protein